MWVFNLYMKVHQQSRPLLEKCSPTAALIIFVTSSCSPLNSKKHFVHWILQAAHIMTEPDTIGYYLVQWDPFGVLSGRAEEWKLVSVDPWPGPAQSQRVSFYGNGAIVTTSRQRPAACLASSIESICRKWGTLWDVQWPVIKPTLTYTVIYRLWISLNPSFTLLTS